MNSLVSGNSPIYKKITQLFPFLTYLLVLTIWPNAGLGNNGHCDAWYYWGMSHGSEIVHNTLSWNYYPASRVPLFMHGWLIPEFINPVIWSKLLMLSGALWPAVLLLAGLRRQMWPIAINGYILSNLVPLIFSQSSANYSGVTFNLLSVLGLVLLLGPNTNFSNFKVGLISGLIVFANVETLVLFPPFAFLYWRSLQDQRLKKFMFSALGLIVSYFLLVLILLIGSMEIRESVQFPVVQIETLLKVLGDETFFGTLENPWFIATPLLMFHLILISILCNKKIKELDIFPSVLLKVISIQLISLVFGQVIGVSVTFQSGFDAIIGYWPLATLYYFILIKLSEKKKNYLGLLSIHTLLYIQITIILTYFIRKTQPALELATFSVLIPIISLIFICFFLYRKEFSNSYKLLALVLAIPLLATHTLDYSYSFYTKENRMFGYKQNWSIAQYIAADQAISQFKGMLGETTAVGAIENASNSAQTSLLRASTRAFSSCGFAWSRFENFEQLLEVNTENWPSQIILGSYRQISNSELHQAFMSISELKRYEFEVQDQRVFWTVIRR